MRTKRKNKINLILYIAIAVSVTLFSCKKDEPEKNITLEDITLSYEQVYDFYSAKKLPQDFKNHFFTQFAGNNIFYLSYWNMGPLNPPFMIKYDVSNKNYSEVTPHESVRVGGFENRLITDGKDLYYIADQAWKYTVSTNK